MGGAVYTPGSKEDFDRLYRECYPRVLGTMLAILGHRAAAEDCTQEAFLRAFKGWAGWKRDAPAEAWLHRVALNVAFTSRRRERLREVRELIRRLGRPESHVPGPDLGVEILPALRALPPKQAAVIVLRHLHGYTNREIAFALGVPERTIASRLAAAKAALRRTLDAPEPALSISPEPLVRSGG